MGKIDELYKLFKTRGRVELDEAAKVLGISQNSAIKWAAALQDDGVLKINEQGSKTYLVLTNNSRSLSQSALGRLFKPLADAFGRGSAQPAGEHRTAEEYETRIAELKRKTEEVEGMEKQRAALIYKEYVPLERRFEVELHLINQQIMDKMENITELEEKMKEFTQRFGAVEAQVAKLGKMEEYMRGSIEKSKSVIEKETQKIGAMQKLAEKHMADAAESIAEQNEEVKEIEKELSKIKGLEDWAQFQQSSFEKRLEEYSKSRKESTKGLDELREAFRTGFIERNLRELDKIKEEHSKEIARIKEREAELDKKIETAKIELELVTGESKEVIERAERLTRKKVKVEETQQESEKFAKDLKAMPPTGIE